ncbi:MAG: fimbrillin family protein [Bacteroidales bacterium]|nr:fimbrillin family protein [Bacteroidales bacterium]
MKKAFTYSALVLLLAASACNKTESVSLGESGIRFAPASVETRALIEDAAGLQAQTFQVYDLLDGASYIEDVIAYADGAWNYASENTYSWKAGAHKFYGFTQNAGTLTGNALSVSKTLTTAEADQTDLLYSEVFSTTAADWKADAAHTVDTPVALHMKHLFSAVSITLKNCTDFEASVTKVTAPAIPNAGSATVSYAGDAVDVTYGAVSASGSFVSATPISSATALASQKSIDVLKMAAADEKAYQLVWPQTLAEDAVTVTVSYTLNGTTYTDKTVALPADTWVAGKKYDYELQILPSDIRLVFVVQPWDSGEAGEINTETGSINMSNVTWMNTKLMVNDELVNTVVNNKFSVYMYKDPYLTITKYPADVYQTYEEDVYAEDGETIIHHAGDQVLDENGDPIILHHEGDLILDENGHQDYQKGTQYSGYYPAQGYFTVNYPKAGLFKIGLKPAVKDPQGNLFDASKYEILIYDSSPQKDDETGEEIQDENGNPVPVGFRSINPDGETITNNTVYFRIVAAANQDNLEHQAQIDIWFKGTEDDAEWISAYSEVRANYACVIPATN